LALPKIDPQPGVEYWLNISFHLKHETAWAPLGHEIAWDQFALPASAPASAFAPSKAALLDVKDSEEEAILSGKTPGNTFSLRFDKKEGVLEQYRYQGVTLVDRGPKPDFWRASTNNDRGAWKALRDRARTDRALDIELWREAAPRWNVKNVRVE